MQFSDNYNYFGYLKAANEVNRQYFQQAAPLFLLKALYYDAACMMAYNLQAFFFDLVQIACS